VIPDINTTFCATNLGPHGPSVLRYAQSLARVHEAKIVENGGAKIDHGSGGDVPSAGGVKLSHL